MMNNEDALSQIMSNLIDIELLADRLELMVEFQHFIQVNVDIDRYQFGEYTFKIDQQISDNCPLITLEQIALPPDPKDRDKAICLYKIFRYILDCESQWISVNITNIIPRELKIESMPFRFRSNYYHTKESYGFIEPVVKWLKENYF